jgi:hypothetical protein
MRLRVHPLPEKAKEKKKGAAKDEERHKKVASSHPPQPRLQQTLSPQICSEIAINNMHAIRNSDDPFGRGFRETRHKYTDVDAKPLDSF